MKTEETHTNKEVKVIALIFTFSLNTVFIIVKITFINFLFYK